MNLFTRIHDFVIAKIPSRLRNSKFFLMGLLALALPATILLTQQIQDTRQRASSFPISSPEPAYSFGQALNLSNGTNIEPNYVDILTDKYGLTVGESSTFEAWIKLPITAPTEFMTLIQQHPIGSGRAEEIFRFLVQNASVVTFITTDYEYSKPSKFTQWTHVAYVRDGNTKTSKFFINGIESSQYSSYTHIYPPTLENKNKMSIGGTKSLETDNNGSTSPKIIQLFTGSIDEMRISNTARYTKNFETKFSPFTPDGNTVALWHFDGNLEDSSGNNYNGQSVGNVQFVNSDIATQPSPTPLTISITPNPTVIPSPSCKTGLSNIQLDTYCNENSFRMVSFSCQDGYNGTVGESTSCKTVTELVRLAQQECSGRSSCPTTPTPLSPTPTAKPQPTTIIRTGTVNITTTPAAQTIKILNGNGKIVAQSTSGKLSQQLNPGYYLVSFAYTNRADTNRRVPATTRFSISRGKTVTIIGDFKTGKATVTTK